MLEGKSSSMFRAQALAGTVPSRPPASSCEGYSVACDRCPTRAATQAMTERTHRMKQAAAIDEMIFTQFQGTIALDSEVVIPTPKATRKAMMAASAADTTVRPVAIKRCRRPTAQMLTRSAIATISIGGNTGVHAV